MFAIRKFFITFAWNEGWEGCLAFTCGRCMFAWGEVWGRGRLIGRRFLHGKSFDE